MNITVFRQTSTVSGLQEQAEVMHIVAGRGAFTSLGGATIEFRAGDTLFFPAHMRGEWRIDETLRKVFVEMGAR